MLPSISIKYDNGNLNTIVSTADGVLGLLASAVAVVDKFALNTPYVVYGMTDVAALGILPDVNNYKLYKALREFYQEAGDGAKLWIMGFAQNTKVSDWFTVDSGTGKAPVQTLLDIANGEIIGLLTSFSPDGDYVVNVVNGLDADVVLAKQQAQILAVNYTDKNYAPLFVLLEGLSFTGTHADLPDLNQESNNRVGIVIGDTERLTGAVAALGAATQIIAGKIAKTQVHERVGKRKNGSLATLNAYIRDEAVEMYNVEALHDKGYITFRTHVRKSGYYITDGPLATSKADDDYHNIALRRTIDKAYRLAHNVASEEILADFDLTAQGTIDPIYAKDVEGNIEREIAQQMTANGELSASKTDKDDLGVKAAFNLEINVVNTNKINMTLKVRPKGYAEFFEIALGYNVQLNNA